MKKKLVLLIICILALTGCGENSSRTDTEGTEASTVKEKPAYKRKTKKTVKKDGNSCVEEYDSEDRLLKITYYNEDSSVRTTFTYSYDEKGNKIATVMEKADGTRNYEKKSFDAEGNLIGEYEGDSEENLVLKRELEYASGLLMKETLYNNDGTLDHVYDYEYENGVQIRKTYTLPSGYLYRSWDYEYDDAGRRTRSTDSMHEHVTITQYDEQDRVVREDHYFKDSLSRSTVNTYGEYGIIDTIYLDADGSEIGHTRYYYENGLVTRLVSVKEDGIETENAYWEYNADGQLIHFVNHRGYESTYEYNEYGDPVQEHNVCNDPLRDAGVFDDMVYYAYEY